MIDNVRTGQNIIFHRQKLGWTQGELAGRLNVTHQAVSKWENGNAFPDITILYELSRLFGVTMEALLTGDPDAAEENMQSSIPAADDGNAGTVPSAQESDKHPCEPETDAAEKSSDSAIHETSEERRSSISEYSWDQIMSLAPFASRDTLRHLVDLCQEECDFNRICSLAPFLGQDIIDRLIRDSLAKDAWSWDEILSLAPFASRDTLRHLVDLCQEECDFNHICSLAPFLRQDVIDRLIRDSLAKDAWSWDEILSLAPFASRDTLRHLLDLCQEECDFNHICSLAPFLGQDVIDRLILNGQSGLSAYSTGGRFPYDEAEKRAEQAAERAMQYSFRKAERMAEKAARKAEEMAERASRKAERIAERASRRAERYINGMEDIGDTIAAQIEEFIFQEISSASEAAHDSTSQSNNRPVAEQPENSTENDSASPSVSDRRTEIVDAAPSAALAEYAEHIVSILYGACDAADPLFERIYEIRIALLAQDYAALNEFAPLLDRIIGPEWLEEYAELCDAESGITDDSDDFISSDPL
ncbi:MAG: helix-turn-helix domain-containing protein [Clostridia bacterium]|nr:helix-turn-helix domain-containing protein [Clostridia bacterium]